MDHPAARTTIVTFRRSCHVDLATGICSRDSATAEFVHHLDHRLRVLNGRLLQHAMSKIENVSRSTLGLFQDLFDARLQRVAIGQQT